MEKLIITPKTKIYDLLEAYPELEDILISSAPEFKKLKESCFTKNNCTYYQYWSGSNYWRTQCGRTGKQAREKVGQDSIEQFDDTGTKYVTVCPEWFKKEAVVHTIDIREMLNRGEQPVHEVLAAIKS